MSEIADYVTELTGKILLMRQNNGSEE